MNMMSILTITQQSCWAEIETWWSCKKKS